MKVSFTYEFPMGHRLQNHEGQCRFLHGHNYLVTVDIDGIPGEDGMIMDFSKIKTIVRGIFADYDHALVLEDTDPIADLLDETHAKLHLLPNPPTAEILAQHWLDILRHRFLGCSLSITVNETRDCKVTHGAI